MIGQFKSFNKAGMVHFWNLIPANVAWSAGMVLCWDTLCQGSSHVWTLVMSTSSKEQPYTEENHDFVAPGVINLWQPQDLILDTYSVGKTLIEFMKDCDLSNLHNDNLMSAVNGLMLKSPTLQMTLPKAKDELVETVTTNTLVHNRLRPTHLDTELPPESLMACWRSLAILNRGSYWWIESLSWSTSR